MRFKVVLMVFILVSVGVSVLARQTNSTSQPNVDEIIRRFAAAESENKAARNNYTFTQDVDIMTIGEAGSITGRFHRISEIVYDDLGNRIEKITFFPISTLKELSLTTEDMQDLSGVQPFALTTEDLPKYQLTYAGKERIDELNTFMFDAKPKQLHKGERYLEGRIWVDDQDMQIVKVAGKAVPEVGRQKFPRFESYRENIDGRYWFPTYIAVDDVLAFDKGPSVHMKMTVRYTNYKKFSGRIKVVDEGEAVPEGEVKPADKNNPTPPQAKPPEQSQPKPTLKRP
ncbi:MAG TPA: hypothetical protein VJZ26_01380 [Blastocatellia bacterium]|nr:hypothetical protein [Blastocatellia bacterium]